MKIAICRLVFVAALFVFSFVTGAILAPASSYPKSLPRKQIEALVAAKEFRSAILLMDQWLDHAEQNPCRPMILVEKAKLLYADQQRFEAQELFLQAVAKLPQTSPSAISDAEQTAFLALFPTYEASIESPEGGEKLLQETKAALLDRLDTPLRRGDCCFLIQQALDEGELVVAERLLQKAGTWYQYSRRFQELAEQLSEKKKGRMPCD